MRLAVSNIAWTQAEDDAVEQVLHAHGVDALEAAPARLFRDPQATPPEVARDTRSRLRDRGFDLVALQSLLFGIEGLGMFGTVEERMRTVASLEGVVRLAGAMEVPVMVYGSPATRRVPADMSADQAFDIAAQVFGHLGGVARDSGTTLCIEPNPPEYGCNFVTTADEGAALVRAVASEGFGLHLDAAGMTLAGDVPAGAIRRCAALLKHFHASAPDLGPLEDVVVDHSAAAEALFDTGFAGVVSVEMRSGEPGSSAARIDAALALARSHYAAPTIGADR